MTFILENWPLILLAATSGGLLLWQTLQKSGSGVGTAEAVRLINELPALFDQAYPKAYRALIGLDQGAIRRKG